MAWTSSRWHDKGQGKTKAGAGIVDSVQASPAHLHADMRAQKFLDASVTK